MTGYRSASAARDDVLKTFLLVPLYIPSSQWDKSFEGCHRSHFSTLMDAISVTIEAFQPARVILAVKSIRIVKTIQEYQNMALLLQTYKYPT